MSSQSWSHAAVPRDRDGPAQEGAPQGLSTGSRRWEPCLGLGRVLFPPHMDILVTALPHVKLDHKINEAKTIFSRENHKITNHFVLLEIF